jgi:large subunit ribosomal protein L25
MHSVEVECLPKELPEKIVADVSGLTLGSTFKVADLQLPEGVAVTTDRDVVIALVTIPRVAEPEETAGEPAVGEPAAAAPAEGNQG